MTEAEGRPSFTWRVALFVLVASATLWLGLSAARTVVGGELLEFGTLTLRHDVPPEAERMAYHILALTGIGVICGYVLVLISAAVVLARAPFRLRDNAWMVMGAILLYLFVPVEGFTMVLDARLARIVLEGSTDLDGMRELFVARAGALAGAPFVAVLSYYTIIALAIFQPLRRRPGQSRET